MTFYLYLKEISQVIYAYADLLEPCILGMICDPGGVQKRVELSDNGWSQTWMRDHLWGNLYWGRFLWQAKIIMKPFEQSVRD